MFLDDIDVISVDIGLALLGVIQLVMVFVVMYGMNAYGRKPLLLWGKSATVAISQNDKDECHLIRFFWNLTVCHALHRQHLTVCKYI